ncbi:unnamed protein product [Arctia plantaginis]|uniref:F-box only protein 9 n=1 Tax=Arctia plantaginis TaxID=874455 RepID=A0A8S0ZU80_ARCPL|nr:unnamed protein product [Arctia plantaginis]
MASGAAANGSGDCEGEEQEDSSSSSFQQQVLEVASDLDNLNVQDDTQGNERKGEDELSMFRQQWQRELEATPTPTKEPPPAKPEDTQPLSDDEKAKQLFLLGVELERCGKLYEAIQHYKRAMQILPDVETRLYDELRSDTPQEESEAEEAPRVDDAHPSDDEDAVEGEDLLARLQRILARKGVLCEPEFPAKGAHISWLPYEVIIVILRWVVSAELDAASLERVSAVCRGLYVVAREPDIWRSLCVNKVCFYIGIPRRVESAELDAASLERVSAECHGLTCGEGARHIALFVCRVSCYLHWNSLLVEAAELDAASLERVSAVCRGLYFVAREPDIWRSLCVKTWGIECGTLRASGFSSWRQMYVERPRLHLHGCYISKTTYIRHGENSFQDQFYRPWYLIDYYRYLRFFPEGLVLMWTTPDEPATSVGHLKYRQTKPGLGIMSGHYRLIGDKVVIVIKKTNADKKASQTSARFRARRKEVELHEQTFHMEFELRNLRSRRNFQLCWRRYSVCSRRDQWTQFELSPAKFPPFAFSRVRTYTAETAAPLLTTHAYT